MPLSNKTRISITIYPRINLILEKESERLGISKSKLVEKALKDFLKKRLEEDAKTLATLHFDDLPSEEEWLMLDQELDFYEENKTGYLPIFL